MALSNFSLPFGAVSPANWLTTANPIQHHVTDVNDLLYNPEGHQQQSTADRLNGPEYYKNDPYAAPTPAPTQYQRQQTYQYRSHNNYLPPINAPQNHDSRKSQHIPQLQPPLVSSMVLPTRTVTNYQSHHQTRTYGEGNYESHDFYSENTSNSFNDSSDSNSQPTFDPVGITPQSQLLSNDDQLTQNQGANVFPGERPTFTRVQAGQGSKTQVHAVLDYDNDDYYDDTGSKNPSTELPQGPIFVRNGTVPVVPLFAIPNMNNGTLVQIPIWWTALSVALGLEIQGDVIRGTPCVKRYHQLFCPTAGNNYPIDRIEEFIDENKALMRRMYGDFRVKKPKIPANSKRKREASPHDRMPGVPDIDAPFSHDLNFFAADGSHADGESYFGQWRTKRQSNPKIGKLNPISNKDSGSAQTSEITQRFDACESKVEVLSPYWAMNSADKYLAIVNTVHFEQAVHLETCTKEQTGRCGGDCGCEQKYKWHRLLAYDPDNDCKGIFMDWFKYPSCCVCRCDPN